MLSSSPYTSELAVLLCHQQSEQENGKLYACTACLQCLIYPVHNWLHSSLPADCRSLLLFRVSLLVYLGPQALSISHGNPWKSKPLDLLPSKPSSKKSDNLQGYRLGSAQLQFQIAVQVSASGAVSNATQTLTLSPSTTISHQPNLQFHCCAPGRPGPPTSPRPISTTPYS